MIKKPFKKIESVNKAQTESTTTVSTPAKDNLDFNVQNIKVESSNLNRKDTGNTTQTKMPQHANNHAEPNGIKGFGTLDESKIIVTCDGIAVLPIKLVSYGEMEITADDYKLCKKYGRSSLTLVEKSAECACYVVKTTDAFAVVTKFDKRYFCKWAMSSFDIVKKVKEHNGVVYVYIKVHDETGDQTIRVPRTAFAEGKTSTLTQYNIAVHKNPGAELAMAVYFTRLLDETQMEDAAQVIGVVKDKNTKDYIFNGYTQESEFKTANQYGNYQGYLEHFNPLLEQSAPLQYLLSATMAAPIMTVLQQKYDKDVHSYIINAVGASSTGKTISSRVCASAWTNPKDTVIFSAMHSTGNAALKKLAGRYGVPTFLDEATACSVKPSEYAYSVYEGVEKETA